MMGIHLISQEKNYFSLAALVMSILAVAVLDIDYFLQISVIQPSLANKEYEGIGLLSQYNPHGIFIALEELGYIFMNLSFVCLFPVFNRRTSKEKFIKWLFAGSFIMMMGCYFFISFYFGIEKEYRFEVVIISIDWLVLIVAALIIPRIFRMRMT